MTDERIDVYAAVRDHLLKEHPAKVISLTDIHGAILAQPRAKEAAEGDDTGTINDYFMDALAPTLAVVLQKQDGFTIIEYGL